MKKFYLSMMLAVILSFAGMQSPVLAESNSNENIATDKMWTITFNTSISLDSAKEQINVHNQDGEAISTTISYGSNEKQIQVHPPKENYAPNTTYTLTVQDEIKSKNGVKAANPHTMDFTTQKEGWGDFHSIKEMQIKDPQGEAYTVHFLADEKPPAVTSSTMWFDNPYKAEFKLALESNTSKKTVSTPIADSEDTTFYQNEAVALDDLVRKINDSVFVISQMAYSSSTTDYFYTVKDGEIEPITFSFADGETSTNIMNTFKEFEHLNENTYQQAFYNNAFGLTLHTQYTLNHNNVVFNQQQGMDKKEFQKKAEHIVDSVHEIFYDDLIDTVGSSQERDFSRIKDDLRPLVTQDHMKEIEDAYYDVCLECEAWYMNVDWSWDIHMNTLENTPSHMTAETVELEGNLASGGYDVVSLKKENGNWKLAHFQGSLFDSNRHLDLSKDQAKQIALELNTVNNVTYLGKTTQENTDHNGDTYTTTMYRFSVNDGEVTMKVDASTGAVSGA
ncbi:Ig-like domain-containing protein [Pontibacillus yanchengensis]|uniref:SbsA Ig-like domain-containing protein n=1 Tax=Pontibacillus yanchengensis Y32 TaxID=1385514 RepID=A0A0A2TZL6_9BACI|nr:Ig-like domain-containing protein [Pontibacillus yanchengensis]KGP74705.1 hypothetical protein N782_00705 [Pontibacillus yanchengensis Y32]